MCHGAGSSVLWGANLGAVQCEKCHGSSVTAAGGTFKNLSGNTTNVTSTLHVSHLASTHNYSNDVTCASCHAVPATPIATNHLDSGKSAEVIAGAGYTVTTKSCTNTCHGSALPASTPARTAPTWKATLLTGAASTIGDGVNGGTNPGSGDCAKCHGFPPQNGHSVAACNTCHTHVSTTNNWTFANSALHMNGNIEVASCNGCHDYDTVGATYSGGVWSGGYWGKSPKSRPNGYVSTAKHTNQIKCKLNISLAL